MQEPASDYQLRITFSNNVGDKNMHLDSTYQNAFNESYKISAFKYYISDIRLQQPSGIETQVPDTYRLVDEAEPSSKSFILNLQQRQFTNISFLIGVDSARNVSGTQTGDLDPAKGMFWTWNTGYIMAKFEATSPFSPAPANKLELHIGGFRTGENTTRRVVLAFPGGSMVDIDRNGISEVFIEADANAWFKSYRDLRIVDYPVCTNPGSLATQFADNYANMFKVVIVKN